MLGVSHSHEQPADPESLSHQQLSEQYYVYAVIVDSQVLILLGLMLCSDLRCLKY